MNVKKMIDFTNKVVIITGGSMGIGEGCTKTFCSAGADVVICSRNQKVGKETANRINEEFSREAVSFVKCDVGAYEDVKNVVNFTIRKFGRLDCLINNAGMHPSDEIIDDVTPEMFDELMHSNLTSMFMFCREALPHLRKTRGSIINMSSLVGHTGQRKACRYVATKAGISGLTKALAIDEGRNGVRINCVLPACIETPLAVKIMNEAPDASAQYERLNSFHQMSRQGTIEETGTVCLFLASDMASFLTGVDVPVSGGSELGYGSKWF